MTQFPYIFSILRLSILNFSFPLVQQSLFSPFCLAPFYNGNIVTHFTEIYLFIKCLFVLFLCNFVFIYLPLFAYNQSHFWMAALFRLFYFPRETSFPNLFVILAIRSQIIFDFSKLTRDEEPSRLGNLMLMLRKPYNLSFYFPPPPILHY